MTIYIFSALILCTYVSYFRRGLATRTFFSQEANFVNHLRKYFMKYSFFSELGEWGLKLLKILCMMPPPREKFLNKIQDVLLIQWNFSKNIYFSPSPMSLNFQNSCRVIINSGKLKSKQKTVAYSTSPTNFVFVFRKFTPITKISKFFLRVGWIQGLSFFFYSKRM